MKLQMRLSPSGKPGNAKEVCGVGRRFFKEKKVRKTLVGACLDLTNFMSTENIYSLLKFSGISSSSCRFRMCRRQGFFTADELPLGQRRPHRLFLLQLVACYVRCWGEPLGSRSPCGNLRGLGPTPSSKYPWNDLREARSLYSKLYIFIAQNLNAECWSQSSLVPSTTRASHRK